MVDQKNCIQLKNVSFVFDKQSKPFFKNLSIAFESAKLHFLTGKNGVGKSTLFRLLQQNVQGACVVQQNINPMLADQFSFIENVRLAAMKKNPSLQPLPQAKIFPELRARFGIDMDTPVGLLSGGQRQILAIVMIVQKPCELLLLDEPTAALDEQNAVLVMQFLQELIATTGLTVIAICHDLDLVRQYSTMRYVMCINEDGVRGIAHIS